MADWTVNRIIYVSSIDPSLPNGPGVNEREFVLALHHYFGNRLRAVVPRPALPLKDFDGVNARYLRHRRNLGNPLAFARAELEMERAIHEETQKSEYDLLITRQRVLPVGFLRASRKLRIPFALRHMAGGYSGQEALDGAVKKIALRLLSPLDAAIWRDLARRAFAIDTPTVEHATRMIANLGVDRKKLLIKDNTVNPVRFGPGNPAEAKAKLGLERFEKVVGYAGGSAHLRGGEQIFAISRNILARFPRAGFVIVGGGEGMEALKARIRSAGLEHAFVTPGVVPYDRVPDYIATFDVGVALDKPEREKVIGNAYQKVRQYISTGVPVVTGSRSVVADDQYGTFVEISDLAALEAAVVHWLGLSDAEREDFRAKAHRYAVECLSTASSLRHQIAFWEKLKRQAVG